MYYLAPFTEIYEFLLLPSEEDESALSQNESRKAV